MTTLERLEGWKNSGAITAEQHSAIAVLVRKERFSVFLELNILLYLGVVSFVAGAGWTVREYFASLGDITIVSSLTIVVGLSFFYCFSRARPYSNLAVESPTLAFDYILYLGCLMFGVELGYLETQFHILSLQWNYYLLFSAAVYFVFAYRFDNRFVLTLALSTLAAWFGVRTSSPDILGPMPVMRTSAVAFAVVAVMIGGWPYRAGIKKHFFATHLHIATNVLLLALLPGVDSKDAWWCLPAVLAVSAAAIGGGLAFRRFAFVAYGVIYGYIAVSIRILNLNLGFESALAYFFTSGAILLVALVLLARRMGRES
jgi:hypothetical protein